MPADVYKRQVFHVYLPAQRALHELARRIQRAAVPEPGAHPLVYATCIPAPERSVHVDIPPHERQQLRRRGAAQGVAWEISELPGAPV